MSILFRAIDNIFSSTDNQNKSVLLDYFGSTSLFSNASFNYKTSLKISAVFNAVDQISNDIAKIPFNLYQYTEKGNKERLKNHPVELLLNNAPNALMTPFMAKKIATISVLLRGNALFQIVYSSTGKPISLKYIIWDNVQDILVHGENIIYYIKGLDKPLLDTEVLHFKNFSHNGIVGVSVITYAAQQMGLAIDTQEFAATNVKNKGVRQGVIETDKIVTNKSGIISSWRTAMSERSADRVVVLDEGMKFKPITITPQELQIIEQSRFNVEDVARWFNIAPHKIKSLQQSTNNNIEQQSLDHVSDTIHPYISNFEQEYTKKLLTSSEKNTSFIKGNINVLLRSDLKARSEWYGKLVTLGVMNRNEIRRLEDYNDGPDLLNEYLTPVNTFTEKQLTNSIEKI